jgi:hypothetical protein
VVSLVAISYFAFMYIQAYSSLHYYIPAMLLPLVVLWRNEWVSAPRRRLLLGGVALAGAFALYISLPVNARPYSTARLIGSSIEDRVGGYARSSPEIFRSTELITHLFPLDWDPAVPSQALGGAPLAWNYYAHTADAGPRNYVLQRATDPPPPNAVEVHRGDEFAVFVRDTVRWRTHRSMRPPSPAGAPLYQVSRSVLFHAGSGEDGFGS